MEEQISYMTSLYWVSLETVSNFGFYTILDFGSGEILNEIYHIPPVGF